MTANTCESILLYYEPYRGTVIDRETNKAYLDEDFDGGSWNHGAGFWADELTLSELLAGEVEPPVGKVGQYGRYGCVITERGEGRFDEIVDVCLFPYLPEKFHVFLKELRDASGARFRKITYDIEQRTLMHSLSLGAHWVPEPGRAEHPEWEQYEYSSTKLDIAAALRWGRAHADRLAQ